jgi:mannose/cellobiose epimerase-like protein (N-acyl-D-glucosamine 2-epimerase family)
MTGKSNTETKVGSESENIVKALKSLMIEHSLPLWSGEGRDPATGGFVEKLDIEGGADLAAPRPVRVQARQIYCSAKAADLGWYPQGREIAMKGLEYLLAKAKGPNGRVGFIHLLDPDGSVRDPKRDTYDQAFVLLALSTVYQLGRDAQVRAELDSLVAFIDRDLRSPHGGFIEGKSRDIVASAKSADASVRGDDRNVRRDGRSCVSESSRRIAQLFVANLYDPQRQVLGEYFEEAWSRVEPASVEPGH